MYIYLNGEFVEKSKASISVMDRGILFGDGVYEVTRVISGKLFKEQEHLDRLRAGLKGLKIDIAEEVILSIPDISRELIKKNGHAEGEASVYLQITRGTAWPRTHSFHDPEVEPTLFLSSASFTPHTQLHQTGVDTLTLPDIRWTRCNLKTVNLLPNILATQQAKEAGFNSAVLIRDGVVTESPNANIFAVKEGALYTFPATNYILNGITRQTVIQLAGELDIPVHYNPVRKEELSEIDELFFSGTTTDIQPINTTDHIPVGSGKPGPVVKRIQEAYKELMYS